MILGLAPLRQIRYVIEAPEFGIRAETNIDLVLAGSNETRLDYHGAVEVRHRMAARMRALFSDLAEDQARGILQRVKVRSEQRRLAHEHLLS